MERDDLREQKIERYKQLVNRSDEESYAFKQLMKTVGRGADYDKLVDEYKAAVAADPNDYRAHMLLGHILRYGGQLDGARAEYEAAVTLKETALAFESLGHTHEANKALADAEVAFEKALELSKAREQKERILRALGAMALHRRHLDKAKGYFERLVELDPKSIFLRKELSELLIENKLYDEALVHLEKAADLAGRNMQTRIQLMLDIGEVYEAQERDDAAIAVYRDAASKVAEGNWLRVEVEERIIGIYRRQNNVHGLVAYYEESWSSPDFDQLMILARLYEELGDDVKALDNVRKAIGKRAKDADARLKLIQLLERRGETDEVAKAYRELIKALPSEARFRFELADMLYRAQRKADALKVLEEASRAFKSAPDVHVRIADKFLTWNERDKALSEYKLLVKIDPKDPMHLESLGEFFFQDSKRDQALETWAKVLKIIPNKAEGHVTLGRIYADHSMLDEAVAEYKLAIALEPDNLQFQRDLGETYERGRRFIDAVAVWEDVLKKTPDKMLRRDARQHIIAIFHQQGTLRANLYQYERMFEGTPPDVEAGYFLAEAHLKLKDLQAAAGVLERLLVAAPTDIEAMLALEKAYSELGDHEKAIALLQRIAEVDTNRTRVYYQKIADAYLKIGDPDAAEKWMVETLRINANDARSYAKLGDVYRKKQLYQKAAEMYEEAIRVDSRAFEHYLVLADIYGQLHRDEDADRLYRAIVRQALDETMVLRAARRSMDYNAFAGTLERLEQDIIPLLHRTPRRPVYGHLLLELYVTMTQGPIARSRSGSAGVREAAGVELEAIGRRALKPMLDALSDEDSAMRSVALELIGELHNPNGAQSVALLLDDPNPEVQLRAALALARMAHPKTVPLLSVATSKYERRVRELATWGLGRTGAAEAVPVLEELAHSGNYLGVRALALIGLGRLGSGEKTALGLLGDSNVAVRAAAAWALGRSSATDAVGPLITTMRDDDDLAAGMAAWALGAIGGERAVEALLGAYWGVRPRVRQAAGAALLRVAHKGPLPVSASLWEENAAFINMRQDDRGFDVAGLLEEMRRTESAMVPLDGAQALIAAHRAVVKRTMEQRLSEGSEDVVAALLRDVDGADSALGWGANEVYADGHVLAGVLRELAPQLRALLASPVPRLRWHAASLLGKLTDRESADAVAQLLASDANPEVRRAAALALGRIGGAHAVDALLAALEDKHFGVQAHAAWALGITKDKRAQQPLVGLLDARYSYVAGMAARGLGVLGDAAAVNALADHAPTAPASVQVEIVRALAALGALARVSPLADSPIPEVRQVFEDARP